MDDQSYFDQVRGRWSKTPLRQCQIEALDALNRYYAEGRRDAACVMTVGAGKTALGIAACLAFTHRRALILTPSNVIRGTFDRAFDFSAQNNVLYNLPGGTLLPGCPAPSIQTLDARDGKIGAVPREELLAADILIANFHTLGAGDSADDVLAKLQPDDIDFLVVDEAHIAAAASYQRAFAHFSKARKLLMSACFRRHDGKPIDAEVVYQYRLSDSIADGHAKSVRILRFRPSNQATSYALTLPDGTQKEVVGREALLTLLEHDEQHLSRITATSDEPIRNVMQVVRSVLDEQEERLAPVKPRVLFSALGKAHAGQVAKIATECDIPTEHVHHSMSRRTITSIRHRYEDDFEDLQGLVQLRMLGQGYDFPPISVVVPMRPYAEFSTFYQFVGRGIRAIQHPALQERLGIGEQVLDVIYHDEMGLDEHIAAMYEENNMDPPLYGDAAVRMGELTPHREAQTRQARPDVIVLYEQGEIERRFVYGPERVEQRRKARLLAELRRKYAEYARMTETPISFQEFVAILTSEAVHD